MVKVSKIKTNIKIIIGLIIFVLFITYDFGDPSIYSLVMANGEVNNIGGVPGSLFSGLFIDTFGYFSFAIPIFLLFFRLKEEKTGFIKWLAVMLYPVMSLPIIAAMIYQGDEVTGFYVYGSYGLSAASIVTLPYWRFAVGSLIFLGLVFLKRSVKGESITLKISALTGLAIIVALKTAFGWVLKLVLKFTTKNRLLNHPNVASANSPKETVSPPDLSFSSAGVESVASGGLSSKENDSFKDSMGTNSLDFVEQILDSAGQDEPSKASPLDEDLGIEGGNKTFSDSIESPESLLESINNSTKEDNDFLDSDMNLAETQNQQEFQRLADTEKSQPNSEDQKKGFSKPKIKLKFGKSFSDAKIPTGSASSFNKEFIKSDILNNSLSKLSEDDIRRLVETSPDEIRADAMMDDLRE